MKLGKFSSTLLNENFCKLERYKKNKIIDNILIVFYYTSLFISSILLFTLLPITLLFDNYRFLKFKLIKIEKFHHNRRIVT